MTPKANSDLYIEMKNIKNSKYMDQYNLLFLAFKSLEKITDSLKYNP